MLNVIGIGWAVLHLFVGDDFGWRLILCFDWLLEYSCLAVSVRTHQNLLVFDELLIQRS